MLIFVVKSITTYLKRKNMMMNIQLSVIIVANLLYIKMENLIMKGLKTITVLKNA